MEKYISFSIGNLRFIDLFAFLPCSLNKLVDSLAQDAVYMFPNFQGDIKNHTELLLRKGQYRYEYISDWQKFKENQLPPIHNFYSTLSNETISQEEYDYDQRVFNIRQCCRLS